MRLHYSFFVFFLLFFTAASQVFSADPDNASAPSGRVVESTNNDSGVTLSVQGPVVVDYDWTGPYIGAHLGYLWGSSDWSAHGTGRGGPLNGSLGFLRGLTSLKELGASSASLRPVTTICCRHGSCSALRRTSRFRTRPEAAKDFLHRPSTKRASAIQLSTPARCAAASVTVAANVYPTDAWAWRCHHRSAAYRQSGRQS